MRDHNPVIECNIGFIDSYLDPMRSRAEWKGFVLLLNKRKEGLSHYFGSKGGDFLSLMPWTREFEKDKYEKPDFTNY
jgi:dipeptidyl-peptidase III